MYVKPCSLILQNFWDASRFPRPGRGCSLRPARNICLFEVRLTVQFIAQRNTATLPYTSHLLCPCFCKDLIVLDNTQYILTFLHTKTRQQSLNKSFLEINWVYVCFKHRLDEIHLEKKKNGKKWLHTWISLCNLAVFVASIFLGRRSQMVSVYFLYSLVLRESWPYFHFPTAWAFGLLQNSRKNFLQENNIWHPSSWLSEGAVY